MCRIREAQPEDAFAISRVLLEARETSYRGVLPDQVVDWMRTQMDLAKWGEILRASRSGIYGIAVAEVKGQVVAYADWGRERDGDRIEEVGELLSLFVLPSSWSNGIGSQLLRFAETRLRDLGFRSAVLWVLQDNQRARRVYERAGWVPDETSCDVELGGCWVRQLHYRKILGTSTMSPVI